LDWDKTCAKTTSFCHEECSKNTANNREIGLKVAAAQVLIKSKKLKNKKEKEKFFRV
jgi:hypothetical protein